MPLWSSATILRFQQQGEQLFANENPCIVDRIALDIIAGVASYNLPDSLISIRRITWKGRKLEAITAKNFRENYDLSNSQGVPGSYTYNNTGPSVIKLFPAPNETIAAITNNLWDTSIPTHCIVEFNRSPDFSSFRIPAYIRRRLLKQYVAMMCFSIEGKGQNFKAAKYFQGKWKALSFIYAGILETLNTRPRKIINGGSSGLTKNLRSARLPIDRFGIGVDDLEGS